MAIQDQDRFLKGQDNAAFIAVPTDSPSPLIIELNDRAVVEVEGCPVQDNLPPCHRCSGNWPGTKLTTPELTMLVNARQINPNKLGCLTLYERATEGLKKLEELNLP